MTLHAKKPPLRDGGLSEMSSDCFDTSEIKPSRQNTQVTNPRAVHEASIASILDESHWLLGDLMLQAAVAQQFIELRDPKGFLYSVDLIVKQAIRAGAEAIELRKLRQEMREAP